MSSNSTPTKPNVACAQVFHIAELRIAILCNLEVRDLLRCKQVSRAFKVTIGSALQRELFLRAGPYTAPDIGFFLPAEYELQYPVTGIGVCAYPGPQMDAKPQNTVDTLSAWRTCTANDALFADLRIRHASETSDTTFGATLPFHHFRSIEEMQAPEARHMFLTQPPVHCAQVYWQFRDDISISATTRTIRSEGGLKWRDVLETVPAHLLTKDGTEMPRLEHCFVRLRNGWVAVRRSGAMIRS